MSNAGDKVAPVDATSAHADAPAPASAADVKPFDATHLAADGGNGLVVASAHRYSIDSAGFFATNTLSLERTWSRPVRDACVWCASCSHESPDAL